jgi:hypothetical protein
MIKIWLVIAGIAGGIVLTSLAPALIGTLRSQVAMLPGMAWFMGEPIQASAARRWLPASGLYLDWWSISAFEKFLCPRA